MRPLAKRIRLLVRRNRKRERKPAKTVSAKLKGRRKAVIKVKAFQKRNRTFKKV
jgi:hypothetical protein